MYTRALALQKNVIDSFFLWGPRKTGKTTLLKQTYPKAYRIDLLKTDVLLDYLKNPSLLREHVTTLPQSQLIVIDEIQKVPGLLDEVHYLIQENNYKFALCGSSARKIKRSHANLLGGRALRLELFGLTQHEIGKDFNLVHRLNSGPIPQHYDRANPGPLLRSYVEDYLREEILQEGLSRNLPVFSDFLRSSAIGDTEIINMSNIARECSMAVSTVREYYDILVDTLLGVFLPAYTKRAKRRIIQAPKFYFRDTGVVNYLTRRKDISIGNELFGKAFENWLFHELSSHSHYSELYYSLSYWRLSTGVEVDFILGDMTLAIECKGKERVASHDLKGLLQLKKDHPEIKKAIVVSLEKKARIRDDILILPWQEFLSKLWQGEWNGLL